MSSLLATRCSRLICSSSFSQHLPSDSPGHRRPASVSSWGSSLGVLPRRGVFPNGSIFLTPSQGLLLAQRETTPSLLGSYRPWQLPDLTSHLCSSELPEQQTRPLCARPIFFPAPHLSSHLVFCFQLPKAQIDDNPPTEAQDLAKSQIFCKGLRGRNPWASSAPPGRGSVCLL